MVIKRLFLRPFVPLLMATTVLTALLSLLFSTRPFMEDPGFSIPEPPAFGNVQPPTEAAVLARSDSETIYAQNDGYRSVLSAVPQHYQDGSSKWQPVNYHHQRWWLELLHLEGATTRLLNRTTYLVWLRVAFPASLAI